MSYSREVKVQCILLRAQGLSYKKISTEIGISITTLAKWSQQFKKEIKLLEDTRSQELISHYQLNRQSKFEDISLEYSRVNQEIKQRDLSRENIKTLLDMRENLRIKAEALVNNFGNNPAGK